MKKLIGMLSALMIITPAVSTMISCVGAAGSGNNESDISEDEFINGISNQIEKDLYVATSAISKSLLLSRNENLGLNTVDPLSNSSKSLDAIEKFQNSSIVDGQKYGQRFSEHFNSFKNIFSSIVGSDGKIDAKSQSINSFIDEESILNSKISVNKNGEKNEYSKTDENLIPLLYSDEQNNNLNAKPNFNKKEQIIQEDRKDEISFEDSTLDAGVDAAHNASSVNLSGIAGIVNNFDASKSRSLIEVLSHGFTFSKTDGGLASEKDPSQGRGKLMADMWLGGKKSILFNTMMDTLLKKHNADAGVKITQKVGPLLAVMEKFWEFLVLNKNTIEDKMGNELYEFVVGTPESIEYYNGELDKPYLINVNNDLLAGNANAILDTKGALQKPEVKSITSKSDGLYGQIINTIGEMKIHSNGNKKSGYIEELGKNDYFSSATFHVLDVKAEEVFEKTVMLQKITSDLIRNEYEQELIKLSNESELKKLISLAKIMNFDLSDIVLVSDLAQDVQSWFIDFDNDSVTFDKSTTKQEILNIFDENRKNRTSLKMMREAAPADGGDPHAGQDRTKPWNNWFSDENENYRTELLKAFGYGGHDKPFRENSIFNSFKKSVKEKGYNKIFGTASVDKARNFIDDFVNKNIIGPDAWIPSNYNVNYKDNSGSEIDNIEYTMTYNGLGFDSVALERVKVGNEYELNQILNLIAEDSSTYSEELKNKLNGKGLVSDLTQVKHEYKVVWKNVSTNPEKIDMRLSVIKEPKVQIDGNWFKMAI